MITKNINMAVSGGARQEVAAAAGTDGERPARESGDLAGVATSRDVAALTAAPHLHATRIISGPCFGSN